VGSVSDCAAHTFELPRRLACESARQPLSVHWVTCYCVGLNVGKGKANLTIFIVAAPESVSEETIEDLPNVACNFSNLGSSFFKIEQPKHSMLDTGFTGLKPQILKPYASCSDRPAFCLPSFAALGC